MKQCTKCKENKSLDDFHKNNHNKTDGRAGKCKVCAAAYNKQWQKDNPDKARQAWRKAEVKSRDLLRRRATRYGLTRPELDAMILEAEGRCNLCQQPTGNLHIDHCHSTNRVRGLLCLKCNTGLGNFNDDVALMNKAIQYLRL